MIIRLKSILIIVILISGCDSDSLWSDYPYEVIAIDSYDNVRLGYDVGDGGYITRVGPRVVLIGSSKKYVVVKQCKNASCAYYYIDKSLDSEIADPNYAVRGPFSEKEFNAVSNRLGLPKLYSLE